MIDFCSMQEHFSSSTKSFFRRLTTERDEDRTRRLAAVPKALERALSYRARNEDANTKAHFLLDMMRAVYRPLPKPCVPASDELFPQNL
jgi:hypothetical protein